MDRRSRPGPFGEGRVVLDWLHDRGIGHFTAAPAHAPDVYVRLYGLKLGMAAPVHGARRNPMISFRT